MSHTAFIKVEIPTAVEVCQQIADLGEDARAILDVEQSPTQYFERLRASMLFRDAVLFLSHALPDRDAVRWACGCLRSVAVPNAAQAALTAIHAAEQWVADPSERNRRAGLRAAEAAGFGTPAGSIALTVWVEFADAPDNLPGHPPRGQRTAPMVARTILLAAVMNERGELITGSEFTMQRLRDFLKLGEDVACGIDRRPDQPGPAAL